VHGGSKEEEEVGPPVLSGFPLRLRVVRDKSRQEQNR
jgi:hypothetical protein